MGRRARAVLWSCVGGGRAVRVHASAVAVVEPSGGPARAVLLMGPSGAGKSSVAAAMLGLGARLVADDRCVLARGRAGLVVSAPPVLRGLIELRGIGLLRAPALGWARVVLAVDLAGGAAAGRPGTPRLPEAEVWAALGLEVALLRASAAAAGLPSALMLYLLSGRSEPA